MSSNRSCNRLSYSTTSTNRPSSRGSSYWNQHMRQPTNQNMPTTSGYPSGRSRDASLAGSYRSSYVWSTGNVDGETLINSAPPAPLIRPQRRASVSGSRSSRPSLPFLPPPSLHYVGSDAQLGRSFSRQAGPGRGENTATNAHRSKSRVDGSGTMRRQAILSGAHYGSNFRPPTPHSSRAAAHANAEQLLDPTALSHRRHDAEYTSSLLSGRPPPWWEAQHYSPPGWGHVERPLSSVEGRHQPSSFGRYIPSHDPSVAVRSAGSRSRRTTSQAGSQPMSDPYTPRRTPSSRLRSGTTAVDSDCTNALYNVGPSPYSNSTSRASQSAYGPQGVGRNGSSRTEISPSDSVSQFGRGDRGLRRMAANLSLGSAYGGSSSRTGSGGRSRQAGTVGMMNVRMTGGMEVQVMEVANGKRSSRGDPHYGRRW